MGILGERVERRFGAGQRLAAGDQACGLVGMGLDALPREVPFLTGLTELCLTNNMMADLPMELGNLTCLKKLRLDKNKLSDSVQRIAN